MAPGNILGHTQDFGKSGSSWLAVPGQHDWAPGQGAWAASLAGWSVRNTKRYATNANAGELSFRSWAFVRMLTFAFVGDLLSGAAGPLC